MQEISYQETWPMRQEILRPKQTIQEMFFPMDDHPQSLHLGMYLADELGGILSFLPQGQDLAYSQECFRLRGMAVRSSLQGLGHGTRFLLDALAYLKLRQDVSYVWCNGRETALNFYRQVGFKEEGRLFDIAGSGPHYRMLRMYSQ